MEIKLENIVIDEIEEELENHNITDINWNGTDLWVDDISKGRYLLDKKLSEKFITSFSTKLSNLVGLTFNKSNPYLEAETKDLRISIIHESMAKTGRSIVIRKTPITQRLKKEEMIKTGYCPEELCNFFANAIKAHCNIVIAGLPSVGKTEFLKWLTQFIPANERAITLEDSLEIHYSAINPGKDCIEIKVTEEFYFDKAIKAVLRHNAKWTVLSEARGKEVLYLMNSLSDGTHCLTTLHTDDVTKIPERLLTMTGDMTNDRFINNIYTFLDIGVLIQSDINDGEITRWVDQVGIITRENSENEVFMLFENGNLNEKAIPETLYKKFKEAKIKNPFLEKGCNTNEERFLEIV